VGALIIALYFHACITITYNPQGNAPSCMRIGTYYDETNSANGEAVHDRVPCGVERRRDWQCGAAERVRSDRQKMFTRAPSSSLLPRVYMGAARVYMVRASRDQSTASSMEPVLRRSERPPAIFSALAKATIFRPPPPKKNKFSKSFKYSNTHHNHTS
jgi:hypothetical protein